MLANLGEQAVLFLSTPSSRRATGRKLPSRMPTRYFYPRPPHGGRRGRCARHVAAQVFLSTPSSRRATTIRRCSRCQTPISIHALLTEGDPVFLDVMVELIKISIHALLTEGDSIRTSPFRWTRNFYPRPPHGGRQDVHAGVDGAGKISIHALLTEGDACARCRAYLLDNFYPRPPHGGRQSP